MRSLQSLHGSLRRLRLSLATLTGLAVVALLPAAAFAGSELWTITASAGVGGAIAPEGDVFVADSASILFTIAPDSCHFIADVLVDGLSVGPVSEYEFTEVHENHTIAASFVARTFEVVTAAGPGGRITLSEPAPPAVERTDGEALTFFVDGSNPACSNTGPGTPDQPYCSIAAAAAQGGPGVTIVVEPGTYREQITVPASGSAGLPLVFRTNGPGVIVEGSDDFSNVDGWAPSSGDVYRADSVTWNAKQVLLDGVRLTVSTADTTALPPQSFRWVAGAGLFVNAGGGNPGAHQVLVSRRTNGFRVNSRSWITIEGFEIRGQDEKGIHVLGASSRIVVSEVTARLAASNGIGLFGATQCELRNNVTAHNGDHGILLSGTSQTLVIGNESYENARPAVRAANGIHLSGSSQNRLENNHWHHNQDSGAQFALGSNDNLSIQNVSAANGDHGFDHQDSPGTFHLGDVAWGNLNHGFTFESVSTGSRVYNAIGTDNGLGTSGFDLRVDASSTSGFASNSNVWWNSTTRPPIRHGAGIHSTVAAYAAATGQDSAGVQADPRFADAPGGDFHLLVGSSAIDNADASWPEWPVTDAAGETRVDDHSVPNTGLGAIDYADRGAFEFRPNESDTLVATCGEDVTFTIAADPHHHVVDVRVDGVSVGPVTSWTFSGIDSAHTLTASFASNLNTLDVNIVGSGSVTRSPDQVAYLSGTRVTLTATAATGYEFTGWTGDASGTANPLELTVTSDLDVTATFVDAVAPEVTVTFPNGGDTLVVGTTRTLTWTATDLAGVTAVDLLISRSGAAGPFEPIASDLPNLGSFEWEVTAPATNQGTQPVFSAFLRVVARDLAANEASDLSDAAFAIFTPTPTGVDDGPVTMSELTFAGPNPARGEVRLGFAVAREERVRLAMLDVQGRVIDILADKAFAPGRYSVTWSGRTPGGMRRPAGIYFASYQAGERRMIRRIVLTH